MHIHQQLLKTNLNYLGFLVVLISGLRWSRLFGQFSAIPKWKSLFSVWPPGGSGGRLKFTGSAMLPSFPYRLTGRVSLSQADCSR